MKRESYEAHMEQRLKWASTYQRWCFPQWISVLFTGESRFCQSHSDGRRKVWRPRRQRFEDVKTDHVILYGGASVNV